MAIKGYKKKVAPSLDVLELKRLIDVWREPATVHVDSRLVVPDTSNRSHTGLSVDHCHLIASMMMIDGFRSRDKQAQKQHQQRHKDTPKGWGEAKQGHDVPVLVRGSPASSISTESLQYWQEVTSEEPDWPAVTVDVGGWFTSLGNGHFMQALNLFHQRKESVFTNATYTPNPDDEPLCAALATGVESIVLKARILRPF